MGFYLGITVPLWVCLIRLGTRASFRCFLLTTVLIMTASVSTILLLVDSHSAEGTVDTVAIDTDTSGNTATSVGTINTCRRVELGAVFDVDVVVMNAVNLGGFW